MRYPVQMVHVAIGQLEIGEESFISTHPGYEVVIDSGLLHVSAFVQQRWTNRKGKNIQKSLLHANVI